MGKKLKHLELKKKEDFIEGQYTVSLPRADARVALKIIDMLGEETVVAE